MKSVKYLVFTFLALAITTVSFAQNDPKNQTIKGHTNNNPFKQLKEELATPNMFRTASGAPGPNYYQQQADYKMSIILDDKNQKIYGEETITYTNKSPDVLSYLWVQLDQNIRESNSLSDRAKSGADITYAPEKFANKFMNIGFIGGFHIDYVKNIDGSNLAHTINNTMMRIELAKPLKSGNSFSFKIKWWYNINNYVKLGGRSGFEHFKSGNNLYVIAQFYPRMAVYNDIEGWQHTQFLGRGEFTLPFGNFDVKITTPADHILDATGKLQNRKKMFTTAQNKRYEQALTSFDKPVVIVTQKEAEKAEKGFATNTKTWSFKAENVRDFAFASSRKFILDAQAVKVGNRTILAESLYPKEGNPLWEEYSTKVVAHTISFYSKMLFDYPYHKAISVHAARQGMEYPMICWNYGRPRPDGSVSERTKNGMIGVVTHEVGHNFFPMIINSDERQWGWMDEGLNTFTELLAEQEFIKDFPSRGFPKDIIGYMKGDQSHIAPIMSMHENVFQSGKNAYSKPAAGLYMLREFILGPELFDYSFAEYAKRWKFKHPTPADFFRTMEDASGTDLDWFWRGWFYSTEVVDLGIKDIKKYYVSNKPTARVRKMAKAYGVKVSDFGPMLFLVAEDSDDFEPSMKEVTDPSQEFKILKDYLATNLSKEEQATVKAPKFIYEIQLEKIGGMPMDVLLEIEYADGTKEQKHYPARLWRYGNEVKKVIAAQQEIKSIKLDPREITADVNTLNNNWPKIEVKSKFEKFKEKKNTH
jgi:hypothetical protein